MGQEIYDAILESLPHHPEDKAPGIDWHGFWVSGSEEIMCRDQETANVLADFFEDCDVGLMHTFHYDDEEADGLNLGWWAVYVDGQWGANVRKECIEGNHELEARNE